MRSQLMDYLLAQEKSQIPKRKAEYEEQLRLEKEQEKLKAEAAEESRKKMREIEGSLPRDMKFLKMIAELIEWRHSIMDGNGRKVLQVPIGIMYIPVVWLIRKWNRRWRSFFVAITGGFTPKQEFLQREFECDQCPSLQRKSGKRYCGACGCGKWPLARLSIKNRLKKHRCPKRKHKMTDYPLWHFPVIEKGEQKER